MLSKSQLVLLVVGLYLSVASADVDCSKRPKFVDHKSCCPMPDFLTPELKDKCQRYNVTMTMPPTLLAGDQSNESRRHHHRHHHSAPPCFWSCVFNETGFYVDNSVNNDKLEDYLEIVYKDSEDLQTTASEAFTTCANRMDRFADKTSDRPRPSPPPGTPVCPHRPAFMMGCMHKTIFKNCPASIRKDTQECMDAREYFENCKPQHRRPSSPLEEE